MYADTLIDDAKAADPVIRAVVEKHGSRYKYDNNQLRLAVVNGVPAADLNDKLVCTKAQGDEIARKRLQAITRWRYFDVRTPAEEAEAAALMLNLGLTDAQLTAEALQFNARKGTKRGYAQDSLNWYSVGNHEQIDRPRTVARWPPDAPVFTNNPPPANDDTEDEGDGAGGAGGAPEAGEGGAGGAPEAAAAVAVAIAVTQAEIDAGGLHPVDITIPPPPMPPTMQYTAHQVLQARVNHATITLGEWITRTRDFVTYAARGSFQAPGHISDCVAAHLEGRHLVPGAGVQALLPHQIRAARGAAQALWGFTEVTIPACACMMGLSVGAGKTRVALALAEAAMRIYPREAEVTLCVMPPQLVETWTEELRAHLGAFPCHLRPITRADMNDPLAALMLTLELAPLVEAGTPCFVFMESSLLASTDQAARRAIAVVRAVTMAFHTLTIRDEPQRDMRTVLSVPSQNQQMCALGVRRHRRTAFLGISATPVLNEGETRSEAKAMLRNMNAALPLQLADVDDEQAMQLLEALTITDAKAQFNRSEHVPPHATHVLMVPAVLPGDMRCIQAQIEDVRAADVRRYGTGIAAVPNRTTEEKLAMHPKLMAAATLARLSFLNGDSLLLFHGCKEPLALIAQYLGEAGVHVVQIHGGIDRATREANIRIAERGDQAMVALATPEMAEFGINFQKQFSRVCIVTGSWSIYNLQQAVGRVSRYGQAAATTSAVVIVGEDGADIRLLRKARARYYATYALYNGGAAPAGRKPALPPLSPCGHQDVAPIYSALMRFEAANVGTTITATACTAVIPELTTQRAVTLERAVRNEMRPKEALDLLVNYAPQAEADPQIEADTGAQAWAEAVLAPDAEPAALAPDAETAARLLAEAAAIAAAGN